MAYLIVFGKIDEGNAKIKLHSFLFPYHSHKGQCKVQLCLLGGEDWGQNGLFVFDGLNLRSEFCHWNHMDTFSPFGAKFDRMFDTPGFRPQLKVEGVAFGMEVNHRVNRVLSGGKTS